AGGGERCGGTGAEAARGAAGGTRGRARRGAGRASGPTTGRASRSTPADSVHESLEAGVVEPHGRVEHGDVEGGLLWSNLADSSPEEHRLGPGDPHELLEVGVRTVGEDLEVDVPPPEWLVGAGPVRGRDGHPAPPFHRAPRR